jgi:ABC-type multidrug transport system fused ATPase/permease subunit
MFSVRLSFVSTFDSTVNTMVWSFDLAWFAQAVLALLIAALGGLLVETAASPGGGGLRAWWKDHGALVSEAEGILTEEAAQQAAAERAIRELQPPPPAAAAVAAAAAGGSDDSPAEAPLPSASRLFAEFRAVVPLRFVLPATALSCAMCAVEFLEPATNGRIWDAAAAVLAHASNNGTAAAADCLNGTVAAAAAAAFVGGGGGGGTCSNSAAAAAATTAAAAESEVWSLLRLRLALGAIVFLLHVVTCTLFAWARWDMSMRMRLTFFRALLAQEMAYYDVTESAELLGRLRDEPDRLQDAVNHGLERCLQGATRAGLGCAMLLHLDWRVGLAGLAVKLLPWALLTDRSQRIVARYGVVQEAALRRADGVAAQALSQPRLVQSHAAERAEEAAYASHVHAYLAVIRQTLLSETALRFAAFATSTLAANLQLLVGVTRVMSGAMTVGQYWAFSGFLDGFLAGCRQLGEVGGQLRSLRQLSRRYFETLDRKPAIGEGWVRPPAQAGAGGLEQQREEQEGGSGGGGGGGNSGGRGLVPRRHGAGRLELLAVSFAYPSRSTTPVLRGLSLVAEAGRVLALCGSSGAGKSTIVKLLQRFYDPSASAGAGGGKAGAAGMVLLDGIDVRTLDVKWLRRCFGYVAQEPVLFNRSIAANIAHGWDAEGRHGERHGEPAAAAGAAGSSGGRGSCGDSSGSGCGSGSGSGSGSTNLPPMSAATRAAVERAAELACADGFIRKLPEGYDSLVGEGGSRLSGGQKQRIAIARAIVRQPPILLLDEATSALDTESEAAVRVALERASERRTTVVIAHRLSTIKGAHSIAVVEDGRVLEQGTHEELLQREGRYWELAKHQVR